MSWLNCGVTTQTIWPSEQKEVKYGDYTFILMPLTKDHSASIHIELKGISDTDGLTLINRFLSAQSWKCDEPAINHYGWSGNPIPVPVPKTYRLPLGYSPSEYFPNEVQEITDQKAKLAVALYREGISLDSVPFKFLSHFKILNIFWNDKYINSKNDLIENLRISLQSLAHEDCVKRINEIKNLEGDAADYLYKSGRCAVAHAYSVPVVDPDDITDLHRLSEDLWLMRNLSVYLIKKEFKIEQSLWE